MFSILRITEFRLRSVTIFFCNTCYYNWTSLIDISKLQTDTDI